MTLVIAAQVWLALFSVTAVGLSQSSKPQVRRWACVLGLLSQPAWFYSTFVAHQWGIFALCFIYAALWARGFYNFWIKSAPA